MLFTGEKNLEKTITQLPDFKWALFRQLNPACTLSLITPRPEALIFPSLLIRIRTFSHHFFRCGLSVLHSLTFLAVDADQNIGVIDYLLSDGRGAHTKKVPLRLRYWCVCSEPDTVFVFPSEYFSSNEFSPSQSD